MEPSIAPKAIQKIGDRKIKIVWQDSHESEFDFRYLRRHCPCALCLDEWTGRPLIDPDKISSDIKAEKAELVGNYAIAFQFSDGHATGIFSFEKLKSLCPCAACVKAATK